MDYNISLLDIVKFSNSKALALERALKFEHFNYQEWKNIVRPKKKITCVSANPTNSNFCAYPKFFFDIFEQALLKSECVPCRN